MKIQRCFCANWKITCWKYHDSCWHSVPIRWSPSLLPYLNFISILKLYPKSGFFLDPSQMVQYKMSTCCCSLALSTKKLKYCSHSFVQEWYRHRFPHNSVEHLYYFIFVRPIRPASANLCMHLDHIQLELLPQTSYAWSSQPYNPIPQLLYAFSILWSFCGSVPMLLT